MKRWLSLAAWEALVLVSVAGLHRLGRSFPPELIAGSSGGFESALAAGLRLTGLAVGYWLAISSVLYLLSRVARLPAALRAIGAAVPGPFRRLMDGVLAGAVIVAIGLPARAVTAPGYVPIPAGDPAPEEPGSGSPRPLPVPAPDRSGTGPHGQERRAPAWPIPRLSVEARPNADPETKVAAPPEPAGITNSPGAAEVVVRAGDHMWSLAERRLESVRGRAVLDSEVAPYWLRVVADNISRIRSGDPDIIFPGEILILPAVDGSFSPP